MRILRVGVTLALLVCLTSGCQPQREVKEGAESKPVSGDVVMTNNKKVAGQFWDALNNGHWETLALLMTPDFVHDNDVDYYYGREACIEIFKANSVEGLDFHQHIDRVTAEGDVVISEGTWSGNHIVDMLGVPATGKSFEVPVVYVMEFDQGLIKRLRSIFRDQRFQNAVKE